MNRELRHRISWWHLRAKRETKDYWIRFVLYYLIFDAFISNESGSGNDKTKLRWFYDNNNSLKGSFKACWNTKLLPQARALKSICPVYDMRPGSTKSVTINDETNIEEIFNVIYQIRCNLFHGSKDVMNSRDSNLVYHAGQFLRSAIDWWLLSTKVS